MSSTSPERAAAQRAKLLGAVLPMCHGLPDFSAPGGASVSDWAWRRTPARRAAAAHGSGRSTDFGIRYVLDRLQEDDGVTGLRSSSPPGPARSARPGRLYLQPGVLVGLGVGLHPGHVARAPGQHLDAVPLTAGHVDHVEPGAAPRHPLVDREVAAKPVVLSGHVGQRALPGQLERRYALGWSCWTVSCMGGGSLGTTVPRPCRRPRASATPTCATTTWPASHYDSKWGINYGAVGQAQVAGKLRKALGHEPRRLPRALEIGAGTGYFTLNLLRAGRDQEGVATDISPGHAARARALGARARPARGDGRLRGHLAPLRGSTRSTSSSATPSCTICRTSTPPFVSSGGCCVPAASWPSAASPPATATASPPCPSAARSRWRPSGGR